MLAVIDPRMPRSAKESLNKICRSVELPPFSALDARVASHPDMLLFKFGKKLLVCREYYREAKAEIDFIINESSLELILTDDKLGNGYPQDIAFNAFIINGTVVGNTEFVSKEIKNLCRAEKRVKQGYAKCSSVVLDSAVITADKGIFTAAKELGAGALLISPNGVRLDGYDCGFIGGASGVWGNRVIFCGDVSAHGDFNKISEFCSAHGYEVISLSHEPLYDVGTILFFE